VRNPHLIARSAAASAVVVLLIAGAAFAGNAIGSGTGGGSVRDQVEATETAEPTDDSGHDGSDDGSGHDGSDDDSGGPDGGDSSGPG
jgi:hypothetical protein